MKLSEAIRAGLAMPGVEESGLDYLRSQADGKIRACVLGLAMLGYDPAAKDGGRDDLFQQLKEKSGLSSTDLNKVEKQHILGIPALEIAARLEAVGS